MYLVVHVQYDSEASGEMVDSRNIASYIAKEEEKLRKMWISDYVDRRGRYLCPWHRTKPRDRKRDNLVQHVRQVARTSHRERANHADLLKVLEPEEWCKIVYLGSACYIILYVDDVAFGTLGCELLSCSKTGL